MRQTRALSAVEAVYTDREGNRCERTLDGTGGAGTDGERDIKTIG